MKKTFKHGDETFEVIWNEKNYNGTKYVEVRSTQQLYGHGIKLVWNDEKGWIKNGGYSFCKKVQELLGFE